MSQIEKAQAEYKKFLGEFTSIIIGTVNENGTPNASYAPFVMDDYQNIYIYVSGLSPHTQNISAHPYVSTLLIEDEGKTNQIFARKRLSFDCTATLIERETPKWDQILAEFAQRFGQIIEVLRGLSDFRLFQLTPSQGRFVIGFGEAYHILGSNLNELVHITGDNAR